ncbi:hypothetical protein ALC57_11481 [Trachymyrmex cornetzi]|uniref:Uncharacterized protein n=1 Tax=Trachymyrmex cornetzi TaxID=471704 RepID=A0A195DTN7_9HYME|nr:hypothetical protein ALC57_11481 [Trachymyrmex cornetzi]
MTSWHRHRIVEICSEVLTDVQATGAICRDVLTWHLNASPKFEGRHLNQHRAHPNRVFFRLVFPRILIPVTPVDIFHLDVLDSITHVCTSMYISNTYTLNGKSIGRSHVPSLRPKS